MKPVLQRLAAGAVTGAALIVAQAQPASSADAAVPAAAHFHTDAVTGVKYLSGGVGDDEQQAIKAESAVYPFDLVFSRKDGAFLVVDKVTVRDRSRIVLTVAQAGPLLLAKLPPGKYAVEVVSAGKTQLRTIEVAKGPHKTQSWRWDDEVPPTR